MTTDPQVLADMTEDEYEAVFAPLDCEETEIEPPAHSEEVNKLLGALRVLRRRHQAEQQPWIAEQRRVEAALEKMRNVVDRRDEYLSQRIEQWARQQFANDPKLTTIKLPNGTIKSTKVRAKASLRHASVMGADRVVRELNGQEEFEDYVTSNFAVEDYPEWVNHKETWSLSKNDVMRLFKEDRLKIIDGVVRLFDPDTGEVGDELPWLMITQPTAADRVWTVEPS